MIPVTTLLTAFTIFVILILIMPYNDGGFA